MGIDQKISGKKMLDILLTNQTNYKFTSRLKSLAEKKVFVWRFSNPAFEHSHIIVRELHLHGKIQFKIYKSGIRRGDGDYELKPLKQGQTLKDLNVKIKDGDYE